VDKLKKDRDKKIEEILDELLPEAFAVVKGNGASLQRKKEIVSTATQRDRDYSVEKEYIRIVPGTPDGDGDKSIYKNSWIAGGTEITWNMVHYDVQLVVAWCSTREKLRRWQPVKERHWSPRSPLISTLSLAKECIS
jgi:preprotein translocase subunit SecA